MNRHLSIEEKKEIALKEILPMLKGDLRMVVDYSCKDHGRLGSGPNFTAALLCLIACEVVGRLSSDNKNDETATKEFLTSISNITGDNRYRDQAKNIIIIFRHGIVHSFVPKQHNKARGRVSWTNWLPPNEGGICVDLLSRPEGNTILEGLRREHLCFEKRPWPGEKKRFVLQPQVFYVDLLKTINRFEEDLHLNDPKVIRKFNIGFDRWWEGVSSISPQKNKEKG